MASTAEREEMERQRKECRDEGTGEKAARFETLANKLHIGQMQGIDWMLKAEDQQAPAASVSAKGRHRAASSLSCRSSRLDVCMYVRTDARHPTILSNISKRPSQNLRR